MRDEEVKALLEKIDRLAEITRHTPDLRKRIGDLQRELKDLEDEASALDGEIKSALSEFDLESAGNYGWRSRWTHFLLQLRRLS